MKIKSTSWHYRYIKHYFKSIDNISVLQYLILFVLSSLSSIAQLIMLCFISMGAIGCSFGVFYILFQFPAEIYLTLSTGVSYFSDVKFSFSNVPLSIVIDLVIFSVLYSLHKILKIIKPSISYVFSMIPKIQVQNDDENIHKKQ